MLPRPFTLLLNRRLDLALDAAADGVHLPASGLPVPALRDIAGPSFLFGRSTHSLDEVMRARDEAVDYVVFGPVFATPSKSDRFPAQGLASLTAVCRIGVPVIAIGGVDHANAKSVAEAGAHGIAAIRLFERPDARIGALRAHWSAAEGTP